MKNNQGFTLIELMVVIVILAILVSIAMPGYQEEMRKKDRAAAQQEMQKIAMLLENHRSRNFSYAGFNLQAVNKLATGNTIKTPLGVKNAKEEKYTITVSPAGHAWEIRAVRADMSRQARNYDLRMTNVGERCMTKNNGDLTKDGCGNQGEKW